MKPGVVRPDPAREFYTPERCHILELSNSANDEALSIARARVEPGIATAFHKVIDTAERYVILSGEGRVQIEGLRPESVVAGDVVLIPPGANQRITNTGDADLIFLALCTPRFRQDRYVATD